MSMKVTKVDGSVDENSGLKYAVHDKSQGFLSRTIDKALGGMQESSEDAAQNKHPVNSVQETVPRRLRTTLTKTPCTLHPSEGPRGFRRQLLRRAERMTRKRFRTRLSQRKQQSRRPQRRKWLSRSRLLQMLHSRRSMRRRSATNTATVQQDVPRDVGPSAIGRKAKACRILGWRQLASDLQMKFFGVASLIKSFSNEGKELIIQQPETSHAAHTGQFGQIVGMFEQMLSHIQSDL